MKNQGSESCYHSKAIEELVRGHESANQLRELFNKSNEGSCGVGGDNSAVTVTFAEDLLGKVLRSFTNTLLLLNEKNIDESEEMSQFQVRDSRSWKPTKSEDSEESCKSTSGIRHRYKRRRTSQTWERDSEAPIEDGHKWRKYGQKQILNAKHPRNYYRCTHKSDQGCLATKQEQKIQDEPPLFKTVYYGIHTCRNLLNPEILLDYDDCASECLISFDNSLPTKQNLPLFSSSSSSIMKECNEEIIQDHHLAHQCQSTASQEDYFLSHEFTFDSSCCRNLTLSSTLESDHSADISEFLCDFAEFDLFEPFEILMS
ncbi:hypothetical protein L6164_000040 [Bauhinia variegata]|uniref:Uncharacterized protein n=1 Tax=Bauhinia variegata TaxID=167791 RepID=A0ACB9Q5D7_BAUVA|nr:hypothetical protein L6164_000040 [Bauhinia variegata]